MSELADSAIEKNYEIEVRTEEYDALNNGKKHFILINQVAFPVKAGDSICIKCEERILTKRISYLEKATNGLKRGFCIVQLE